MHEDTRACIAYIAGVLISGKHSNIVYDHSRSTFKNISGSVEHNYVNIYDHDRDTFITGDPKHLYDYFGNSTISLSVKGKEIHGYDHGDKHEFRASVETNSVNIYHHENVFSYSL